MVYDLGVKLRTCIESVVHCRPNPLSRWVAQPKMKASDTVLSGDIRLEIGGRSGQKQGSGLTLL